MHAITPDFVERRGYPRVTSPRVHLQISNDLFTAVEWGFSGFVIEANPAMVVMGAPVLIHGILAGDIIDDDMPRYDLSIRARVARVFDEEKRVALAILNIDERAYLALNHIHEGIIPQELSGLAVPALSHL